MLLQEVPSLYTMTTASNLVVLTLPTAKERFPSTTAQSIVDPNFYKTQNRTFGCQGKVNLLHSLKAQLPLFHFTHRRAVKNSTQTSTDAHATLSAALHLLSLSLLSFVSLGCK